MELREFVPQQTTTRYLPWDTELKVMPLGDLHNGADGFKPRLLKEHVKMALDLGCYFLGMGDYTDFVSSNNREKLANAGLYDTATTIIDRAAQGLTDELIDILLPTKGRWLGMLQGNHYYFFKTGTTSDTMLCEALDADFLGDCGLIQVRFKEEPRLSTALTIWCHHGYGNAITPGGILNKLHRAIEACEADVYLMAHVHRLLGGKPARLYATNAPKPRLLAKDKIVATTGSFMATYEQGSTYAGRAHGSYGEIRAYPPAALGAPLFTARPIRVKGGTPMLELHLTM